MLFKVYVDDSSDAGQNDVAVVGAFIGKFKQWSFLKKAWRGKLKREGIQYFKSSEYNRLDGQFRKYRDPVAYPRPRGSEAARQFRADLDGIVQSSKVVGWALCLPLKMYWSFRDREPDASAIFTNQPFEFAVQLFFRDLSDHVRTEMGDSHRIGFIVDESSAAERIEKTYLEFKRINPALATNMKALVHLDDKTNPPLQAADMMANMTKELFLEWDGQGKLIPGRLAGSIQRIVSVDEEYLRGILGVERKRRGLI